MSELWRRMEDPGSQKGKEPRGQVWVEGERVGRGSEKGGGRRERVGRE